MDFPDFRWVTFLLKVLCRSCLSFRDALKGQGELGVEFL